MMNRKVLVLNQDYSPITICTTNRAFLLVYLEKAELIKSAKDSLLRTVTKSFPMPSVIRIFNYVNLPYRGVILTRHNVFKRDNQECQYCGDTKDLTLDHVIPKSKGGKSSWNNLVTACKKCNTKKGDHSLEKSGMQLKNKPSKPSYIVFLRNSTGIYQNEWLPFLDHKNSYSEL